MPKKYYSKSFNNHQDVYADLFRYAEWFEQVPFSEGQILYTIVFNYSIADGFEVTKFMQHTGIKRFSTLGNVVDEVVTLPKELHDYAEKLLYLISKMDDNYCANLLNNE